MKRFCIMNIVLLSAVCIAAPTANEDFVIAEDARTYTNAVRDAVAQVSAAFATVSNRAMSAVQPAALNNYATTRELDTAMTDTKNDAVSEAGINAAAAIHAATQAVIQAIPPMPTDYIPVARDGERLVNEEDVIAFSCLEAGDFYPDYLWISSWSRLSLSGGQELPQYLSSGIASATNALADRVTSLAFDSPYAENAINGMIGVWANDGTVNHANTAGMAEVAAALAVNGTHESGVSGANIVGSIASVSGQVSQVSQVVNLWETYWDGDEVRVTVTNYDSAVHLPSLYLEQKVENTNAYRVVWSESTRWASNALEMAELRSAVDEKADRAWGFYDSHTGEYAPDGYTWLSSPKIAIAGGLAYQRTLTTDGAVWVLVSNGMVAETGGEITNGFFRIKDDEGNTTFEIVRGNKRTVGATAAGIRVTRSGSSNIVTVPYNVTSDNHPTVYGTTDLASGEWAEISATWLGQSGAWTAQVSNASATFFIKGEYETGGETYIKNVAPISAESGIYCTDKIHKVRPVYNSGNITWEVVP